MIVYSLVTASDMYCLVRLGIIAQPITEDIGPKKYSLRHVSCYFIVHCYGEIDVHSFQRSANGICVFKAKSQRDLVLHKRRMLRDFGLSYCGQYISDNITMETRSLKADEIE